MGGKNETEDNPLLISKQTPFTQAWLYGEWQKMVGRKVRRFEVKKDPEIVGFFKIIKYPLLFSQSFLYIPHGPILKEVSYFGDEFLKTFHDKLLEIAKEEKAIFVRFDFFLPESNPMTGGEGGANLSKFFKKVPEYAYHSSYFQPKFEWMLDLTKTEEEILSRMHPKNRYSIRLAGHRGIEVEITGENFKKYFSDFYRLLKETAKRGDFNLHPKNYYQNIFETLTSNNAFLVVAKYGGKILLVNLILLFGNTAYFLFGGSSDEHKNLMFSHLAQWEAIKEAKTRGMAIYNFGGVQGGDSVYKNYEGISVFKKRFGGEIFEYSDSYDLILKPFWYLLYSLRKRFQLR